LGQHFFHFVVRAHAKPLITSFAIPVSPRRPEQGSAVTSHHSNSYLPHHKKP